MKKIFLALVFSVVSVFGNQASDLSLFSFGSGDTEIFIVSDPDCPFCQKLAEDRDDKFKNYKVSVLLYASPVHTEAKRKINYILETEDNEERYHRYKEMMIGEDISYKDIPATEKTEEYLKKMKKFIKENDIKRVPVIFTNEDGELFEVSYSELEG